MRRLSPPAEAIYENFRTTKFEQQNKKVVFWSQKAEKLPVIHFFELPQFDF
jgi:hypothetical protein